MACGATHQRGDHQVAKGCPDIRPSAILPSIVQCLAYAQTVTISQLFCVSGVHRHFDPRLGWLIRLFYLGRFLLAPGLIHTPRLHQAYQRRGAADSQFLGKSILCPSHFAVSTGRGARLTV